jgi:hypothetical protein
MKKILLLLVACSFIQLNVQAQDSLSDNRGKLKLGLKLGGNYSNVYDTEGNSFDSDPKFGIVLGGFASIPLGKTLGLQPEILFSQKGFKATGILLGSTYDLTRTTNYLDIPLLVSIKPTNNISLLIGPEYSYLLKVTNEFKNGSTTILQEQEFDNDNIRKNTLGFIVGADINIEQLVISGRLGWDLINNNGDGTSTTPRYKNAWYQFTLGYLFM